jgi:hypothetical protein
MDGLVRLFDERQQVASVRGVQNDRRARFAAAGGGHERKRERDENSEGPSAFGFQRPFPPRC